MAPFWGNGQAYYRFLAVAVNFPQVEAMFPAAELTAVSRTLGRSVSARERWRASCDQQIPSQRGPVVERRRQT